MSLTRSDKKNLAVRFVSNYMQKEFTNIETSALIEMESMGIEAPEAGEIIEMMKLARVEIGKERRMRYG